LWRRLDRYGYINLFLAELNAEVIAALLVIPFGDTVCFKRVGWSGRHKNCSPNKVLFWEAAKWAKDHGYRYCDYDGIDPDSARAMFQGKRLPVSPDVFKTALGGRVIFVPGAYARVYNPVPRWVYRKILLKFLRWSPAQKWIGKTWFWLKSFNRKPE
jgi:lipid II:glycine glycyltransferase (peptidoglycan interpeptide bridge formation enzyme)